MSRLPLACIKFCLTSSLPLGGKVDKAKLWTNEGRNLFSIRIISIKGCNLFVSLSFVSLSLSPFGNPCRIAVLRQSRQVKRRAAPIEVYLKFRLMLRLPLACIKFCLTSSLPLGGKVDKAKLWTNEGRNLFSIRIISIKGCNLFVSLSFVSLSLSPFGNPCRIAVLRQSRQVEWRATVSQERSAPFHQTKPLINSPARPASIRTQE